MERYAQNVTQTKHSTTDRKIFRWQKKNYEIKSKGNKKINKKNRNKQFELKLRIKITVFPPICVIQTTIIQFWICDIIFCWNKSFYSRFFFLHKRATFFIWLICINSDRECACACGSDINTFLDLWQKKNKNIFWYWNFFVQKYVTQSHNPHRQFIEKKNRKKEKILENKQEEKG